MYRPVLEKENLCMMHISKEVFDGTVVLTLEGRFDFHAMENFLAVLSQAEKAHQPQHIVMDLHQVTFIDSSAIGRLVGIHHRLQQSSVRFTLAGQTGYVDTVLREIKLEDIISTVNSVEDGLALPPLNSST
jgi:stage II sporulation protein AA (anti-sigma F factor antagonist)